MGIIGRARLVVRHGKVAGLHFSLGAGCGFRFVPQTDVDNVLGNGIEDLRARGRAVVATSAPALTRMLNDPSFDELVLEKQRQIQRFWAERDMPTVNELMVSPQALVVKSDAIDIVYDADTADRFDRVMAIRHCMRQAVTASNEHELFSELPGIAVPSGAGELLMPAISATAVGVNVVRVVRSERTCAPVGIFTLSGTKTIAGASTSDVGPRVLASTGGAVCPAMETSSVFGTHCPADREMKEETGVGLLGGKIDDVALLTQHDGQISTMQVHDLSETDEADFDELLRVAVERARGGTSSALGVDHCDPGRHKKLDSIEKAFVQHGLTFEFFAAVRSLAEDSDEADRYVAVPLTRGCLESVLLNDVLEHRSWTTLMLVELAERQFGFEFADDLVARMASGRQPVPASSKPTNAELEFLHEQLAGD